MAKKAFYPAAEYNKTDTPCVYVWETHSKKKNKKKKLLRSRQEEKQKRDEKAEDERENKEGCVEVFVIDTHTCTHTQKH